MRLWLYGLVAKDEDHTSFHSKCFVQYDNKVLSMLRMLLRSGASYIYWVHIKKNRKPLNTYFKKDIE